ncbi:uncharacterized protein F4812DRAFT_453965 [Daldinia caldariorum]|uniref:uncharacterized protein n=1 Tax=Daldinia caldariorum TaxID=326644 RepID=UPI002008A321|nr:uncharacterized protein F4812DRAFT_453965 [Daldinia caldariorum]KAI1472151.1 hypothetical protein F4812DRAFT_453965 [Daldinia caldariorum]
MTISVQKMAIRVGRRSTSPSTGGFEADMFSLPIDNQQRANEISQEGCPQDIPQAKKLKTRSEIELDAWASWKYPSEFWDRLSKVELTRRALEELDRRTKTRRPPPTHTATTPGDLARFARYGDPNLCDLRGYPEPRRDRPTSPTLPTSATNKSSKSTTPYNRNFDQHLTDYQIYPSYSSQKPDLTHIRIALAAPRPSLSPSQFSDSTFEAFEEDNARAKDEADILANVILTILGTRNHSHLSARNTAFGNLEHLTDGTITLAKPDIYYGAYPAQLTQSSREKLSRHIVPSTTQDKPITPNFFVEVKGPDGSAAAAARQARYDGAIGSRAMHSLQNYSKDEPVYDNNAYTFSSTYHDGTLKLYAHHLTEPTTEGGRPEYHVTQTDTWGLTGNIDIFRHGTTAFRNARDLAKRHRYRFIEDANNKTRPDNDASFNAVADHADASQRSAGPGFEDPPASSTLSFSAIQTRAERLIKQSNSLLSSLANNHRGKNRSRFSILKQLNAAKDGPRAESLG